MTRATDGRLLARGEVQRAHSEGPAMCYPSAPTLECGLCVRRRHGYAMPAAQRDVVVIDASAIPQKGGCALWIGREVVHSFADPERFAPPARAFSEAA